MTISREKCSEMVREADLDWQRGFCLSGENNRYEALINDAYQKGQRNMQERAANVFAATVFEGKPTLFDAWVAVKNLEIE